jgi:hypothetical protein
MPLEGSKSERVWEPMQLTVLGNVGDVVQVGMGKLTAPAVDPGEPLKTKPSDP